MVLVHGGSYELPYGKDFGVKNGGFRLAPIIGKFFPIYQYHNLIRPEIRAMLVMTVVIHVTVSVAMLVMKVVRQRCNCLTEGWFYYILR